MLVIRWSRSKNRTLAETWDALLPKLLSGDIRVAEPYVVEVNT